MNKISYTKKIEDVNKAESIVNELIGYYNEGPRKQQRRRELYDLLIEELIVNKNYELNFSELAKQLGVERKSLYRYFASKEDILVDIAYLAVIYINEKYQHVAKDIYSLEEYDNITKLKLTLRDIANTIIYYRDLAPFIQYFDDVLYRMEDTSPAKVRYQSLMTEYKHNNHYLTPILNQLRLEGKLIDKYSNQQLAEIFEQSYSLFVSRTITKIDESDRYSFANINILIDILLNGIIIDYKI